jgi:hypothetical protein
MCARAIEQFVHWVKTFVKEMCFLGDKIFHVKNETLRILLVSLCFGYVNVSGNGPLQRVVAGLFLSTDWNWGGQRSVLVAKLQALSTSSGLAWVVSQRLASQHWSLTQRSAKYCAADLFELDVHRGRSSPIEKQSCARGRSSLPHPRAWTCRHQLPRAAAAAPIPFQYLPCLLRTVPFLHCQASTSASRLPRPHESLRDPQALARAAGANGSLPSLR